MPEETPRNSPMSTNQPATHSLFPQTPFRLPDRHRDDGYIHTPSLVANSLARLSDRFHAKPATVPAKFAAIEKPPTPVASASLPHAKTGLPAQTHLSRNNHPH